MDNPRKCVIYFEDRLSEEEVAERIRAIRMIDGVGRVSSDQTSTKVPRPEPEATRRPPTQYAREPEIVYETEQDTRAQRMAIDRALAWGMQTGRVDPKMLGQAGAEQIVALAMQLLEEMPEDQKEALSYDIGQLAGGGN